MVLRRMCTSQWIRQGPCAKIRAHPWSDPLAKTMGHRPYHECYQSAVSPLQTACSSARETHGRALHRLSHMLGLSGITNSPHAAGGMPINSRRAARGLEAQRPAPVASIRSRQRRRGPLHIFFDGEQPGVRWLVQAAMGAQHESAHAG